jgi:GntR family transcriptional regulator, regulator for abcA and norABC
VLAVPVIIKLKNLTVGKRMQLKIDWRPDKTLTTPIYLQIKEFIQGKIELGEWTVGTVIPSQRRLAELFEVNRSTIVQAFDELMADGFLEGQSGRGTKVKNNLWSLFSSTPPTDWNHYVKKGIFHPNLPTIQDIHKVEPNPDYIRLGTGEPSPELFPKEMMSEVLMKISSKIHSLGYEEERGFYPLREQLSIYLKSIGINASPESILIVSGALQALQLISLGLLKRGSTIFLEKPSYLSSLNVFQSAGIKLHGIPLETNGISTSYIQLHKKREEASLLYTNPTFHNPTGYVMSMEARKKLLKVCEEWQLPIVEDDVYRELWLEESPPRPLKALDQTGTVLYLGSISKALSPGLRIGWVVGPEQVIERLADIKMQTDYGASSLSQWAVSEWLASGLYGKHLEQMRDSLRDRRDVTLQILEKEFTGIAEWNKPMGGFYIWLKLPPKISMKRLFDGALKEGILLNPGNLYDATDQHHLRLSYAYASMAQLETGLKKLAALIRKIVAE